MNCEELRQNSAAYALGALSENERAEFERHIAECDLDHEVELYGEVALRLSRAAPELEPPAGLRDRIVAAAASDLSTDSEASRVPGVEEGEPALSPRPNTGGALSRFRRWGAPAYAAAATLLIAIGAVVGWGVASLGDEPGTDLRHFHREDDGDWLRVETELGSDGLTLSVGNLDRLDSQTVYRFWAIRDEAWVPIGDFNTNADGRWSGYFKFSLEQGDSIAITAEPDDTGDQPTANAEIRSRI